MNDATKRWKLYPQKIQTASQLAQHLHCHPLTAQVLLNRRIRTLSEARRFLSPVSARVNFDENCLETASAIIETCIRNRGQILLFGDYDTDGMTSTALLSHVLKRCGANVRYHIPHRFTEGYGLNKPFVENIVSSNSDVFITLDCGISNFNEIRYLKEKSATKVLILDHHTLQPPIPPADVILTPKSFSEEHPLYSLATVGIVFKFLEFFCHHYANEIPLEEYLDLVALGTIADIVPLTNENRYFVRKGLSLLSQRKRPSLKAMLDVAGLRSSIISERDVAFMLAPMLNACGRLTSASLGVEMLLCEDENQAVYYASQLRKLNEERRHIGNTVLQESIEHYTQTSSGKAIVLAGQNWHAGVIGITAAQLARLYSRPTVLISYDQHIGRASARSIGDLNIYELLKECSNYFVKFGGHKAAAGFSILPEKIKLFQESFQTMCEEKIQEGDLKEIIKIDACVSPPQLTLELAYELQKIAPFGNGNSPPHFYTDRLAPIEFKTVGEKGAHIKARFTNREETVVLDGIGFGLSEKLPLLYKNKVELVFHLEVNEWMGISSPQVKIVDIK